MDNLEIYQHLEQLFPNVECELDYKNLYQLLIAVVLSQQTTDLLVNKVTKKLFEKYPDVYTLSKAKVEEVIELIKIIGLAPTKAKNLIALSKRIVEEKNGEVPSDFDFLTSLPGVGRKTANVVLSEGFKIPRIAVDTHVLRVSNRLGFINSDNPFVVEKRLMEIFPESLWSELHLRLIHFGRYHCQAKKPNCIKCPFIKICQYQTKNTLK